MRSRIATHQGSLALAKLACLKAMAMREMRSMASLIRILTCDQCEIHQGRNLSRSAPIRWSIVSTLLRMRIGKENLMKDQASLKWKTTLRWLCLQWMQEASLEKSKPDHWSRSLLSICQTKATKSIRISLTTWKKKRAQNLLLRKSISMRKSSLSLWDKSHQTLLSDLKIKWPQTKHWKDFAEMTKRHQAIWYPIKKEGNHSLLAEAWN